jgi:hypothetical protein
MQQYNEIEMKYTLLALLALMSAPKGVASNAVLEDVVNQIKNSSMNFGDMKDYALSMLFNLAQNEATESAINNIILSSQKDDLVKALKQYAFTYTSGELLNAMKALKDEFGDDYGTRAPLAQRVAVISNKLGFSPEKALYILEDSGTTG